MNMARRGGARPAGPPLRDSQGASMGSQMTVGERRIGAGNPVYLIAEMSANHGQSFDQAVAWCGPPRRAGADAVKLQTYTADTITIRC